MATAKEDGTVAAAEQMSLMSLGESVEKSDNETEGSDAEKNGTPTKFCSACGKKSDAIKKCTACKCVWYCDKECQNKHRKEHRKECKVIKKELAKRGGKLDLDTEKEVGPLGKVPPREECPICMRVLPIHTMLQNYNHCCGKILCSGCAFQHQNIPGPQTCAFCREPIAKSEKERLTMLTKRVELRDPIALCSMAMHYGNGTLGLATDQTKCIDLLRQSASLGSPSALYQLGNYHRFGRMGLEQNEEEAIKCCKKGAEIGDLSSWHDLGLDEMIADNHVAAMRHLRLSASGGYRDSIVVLMAYFGAGLLHHGDLAETLQAFYASRAEMASEGRAKYIAYLKETGAYKEQYDL